MDENNIKHQICYSTYTSQFSNYKFAFKLFLRTLRSIFPLGFLGITSINLISRNFFCGDNFPETRIKESMKVI